MPHPANRLHRRLLNRKHRPYDGDRHLTRQMQHALDEQQRRDREALASEWDHATTFTITGQLIALQAVDWLHDR